MTWGAVNEWTTQAGYARLAARAGHPVLTSSSRIMRQEGRHIDFYASQATAGCDGTPGPRLTRPRSAASGRRSGRRPAPGRGGVPRPPLFVGRGGPGAMTEGIDRRFDQLPGLEGSRAW